MPAAALHSLEGISTGMLSPRAHSPIPTSPRSPSPVGTISTEHVTRLLNEMDVDLDNLISVSDVLRYISVHNLPTFSEELVEEMFAEANATQDGLIDVEQLGKAVGGQFPHRKYTEDWLRLFELAIGERGLTRLTGLPPSPVVKETIRTNYEQAEELCTFAPHTNFDRSKSCTASGLRQQLTHTFSNLAGMLTGDDATEDLEHESEFPRRPAATDLNAAVNQHMPRASDGASKTVKCTFGAQAAFQLGTQLAKDSSNDFGWRSCLTVEKPRQRKGSELYYGLHEREWQHTPSNAHLSLRVDGEATRTGSGLYPARLMQTENSLIGSYNSRAHREHTNISAPKGQPDFVATFSQRFVKRHSEELKMSAARERYGVLMQVEGPKSEMDLANGQPYKQSFRPPFDPSKAVTTKPYVSGSLGYHWPKKEGRAFDTLYTIGVPSRLALTENQHPASRYLWK
ncbi:hypothetical protein AB1Y20_004786 [Prymnesium parvum]|uniref:EF-hand domain-containing protein n=1 Tax=Prymnesium parvum TaxID=97485 RepID=A0AB34IXF8_PRYPA